MALLLSGHDSVNLNVGDFLAFFSGISWAIGSAMIKRFENVPLPGMTLCQFTSTALGAVFIGYITGAESHLSIDQVLSVLPIISLVSIAIMLPVVFAILWAQKFINPGRVGLLMMSEVIVAVLSASLLLPDERMTTFEWCGAVLIIGACLIEVLATFKPKPELNLIQQRASRD